MVAAKKTYTTWNTGKPEAKAAQKTYETQKIMTELDEDMEELIHTENNNNKRVALQNAAYDKALKAKIESESARMMWKNLLPSREAGGRRKHTQRKRKYQKRYTARK
jgi:allantoicase